MQNEANLPGRAGRDVARGTWDEGNHAERSQFSAGLGGTRSEYRVYAGRIGLSRLKAAQDRVNAGLQTLRRPPRKPSWKKTGL